MTKLCRPDKDSETGPASLSAGGSGVKMLIVGERINSTRTSVRNAISARNANFILKEARSQLEAGATYIDINCAVTSGDETQDIDWVLGVIQNGIKDVNICIDSPNCLAITRALDVYNAKGDIVINSITGEEPRIDDILPLAVKHNAKLIALTMDERGMPETAQQRFEAAELILKRLKISGFKEENLYFDPLIRPISTEPKQAKEFLASIPLIKGLGKVKTICGLSNISFGLPARSLVNSVFLTMAIQSGLDAAILDPLDARIMPAIVTSRALLEKDEYCGDYIKAFRAGRFR